MWDESVTHDLDWLASWRPRARSDGSRGGDEPGRVRQAEDELGCSERWNRVGACPRHRDAAVQLVQPDDRARAPLQIATWGFHQFGVGRAQPNVSRAIRKE